MVKKEFKYRGRAIEELRVMSMDDLVKICPARIRRSLRRGFTEAQKILISRLRKTQKMMDEGGKPEKNQDTLP